MRRKTDLKPDDIPLLDELARAIGIDSRATANSILIQKCAKHLIQWFSSDPHTGGCLPPAIEAPRQPITEAPSQATKLTPLEF